MMTKKTTAEENTELEKFEEFILKKDHPCLMAQSVFRQKSLMLREYGELGAEENAEKLLCDIGNYLEEYDFSSNDFYTFIAVFQGRQDFSEEEFEKQLWRQLQSIHNLDETPWDQEVDSDPESDNFSFSIHGKAFYVVGMHPNSSRIARQSPRPAMVFNLHWQFEQLRKMGSYETTRNAIRERDKNLQGTTNPMLHDFGRSKEAPQYSGRQVGEEWKCPFATKQE